MKIFVVSADKVAEPFSVICANPPLRRKGGDVLPKVLFDVLCCHASAAKNVLRIIMKHETVVVIFVRLPFFSIVPHALCKM